MSAEDSQPSPRVATADRAVAVEPAASEPPVQALSPRTPTSAEGSTPAPRLLVSLCTYNEAENLPSLIPEIWRYVPQADVLVVDDGSPDGTGQIADGWASRDARVRVLHRPGKLGLGTAIRAALSYAIERDYTFVVNLDADFSHPPQAIPALLACMDRADVAIGSRYVPGGGVAGWGPRRHLMSRCINLYARLLLGLETRDNSGAFRCYRVAKLRALDLEGFLSRGYAFQEEMLYRCRFIGCRFAETPILFDDRRYGRSKITSQEALAALWIILRLGVWGG
ncbi:MAG: polyprenol monophosphomannose synthase [Planctomycetaceae bacterium]